MLSKAAIAAINSTHRKVRKTALHEIGFNQEDLIPLLAKVVVFLNDCPDDSRSMWVILTALRGPDAINPIREGQKQIPYLNPGEPIHIDDVKLATTAVIRHSLGLTGKASSGKYKSNPDSKTHRMMRRLLVESDDMGYPIVDGHFLLHAMKAFEVLGLNWEKVNR